MNYFSEAFKIRILIGMIGVFIFSGFQSCQDLEYMNGAKTTMTTIKAIQEDTSRRGHVGYNIYYMFKNENSGKVVKGRKGVRNAL